MNEDRDQHPPAPGRAPWPAALLFPIILWAFATLYYGGDLGRWNDDYFFNLRSPVTDTVQGWAVTTREPYLPETGRLHAWRPLLFIIIPNLNGYFWHHFWVVHAVGALLHGAACLLLFYLLRAMGRSLHTSAACALLFLCWAGAHEAWTWPSAFGSVTSTILLATICLAGAAFARRERAGWWLVFGVMLPAAALLLCFNEQASGAFAALPLLVWALCPRGLSWGALARRGLIPAAAVCVLPPLYVLLVRATAQPGLGVSAESYVPLDAMFTRLLEVADNMAVSIGMRDFALPALGLGVRELLLNKTSLWVWGTLLAAAWAAGAWAWSATPAFGPGAPARREARHALVFLFGIVGAAGACLPIAVINGYPALSRVTYVVIFMLLIAGACVFDGLSRAIHGVRPAAGAWRTLSAAALGVALAAGAVMTIGAHARLRLTTRADERNGQELRELVPSPAPGTVFLPVSIRPDVFTLREILLPDPTMPIDTVPRQMERAAPKFEAFRRAVRPVWEGLWSMRSFVKWVYGRDDVHCLYAAIGLEPILDLNEREVRFIWPFGVPYHEPESNNAVIPVEMVIPITFDERGRVRIVTSLVLPYIGGGGAARAEFPQALALAQQGRIEPLEVQLPPRPQPSGDAP
ncbi:MAG: hypothetical protein KF864_04395 [Phycisphaeraceae bacterium]|nr:hypothetical protein [Phycisphaeraceae bacterium]